MSHSGSLFNSYAFSFDPQKSIDTIVRRLGLSATSPQGIVDQMRSLPAQTLVTAIADQFDRMPRLFDDLYFVPSIDPQDTLETRIFSDSIDNLIASGNINRVPYIIGFNSFESMYSITDLFQDPTLLNRFNQNPNLLIPPEWDIAPNSPEATEVITAFRNLYFGGSTIITSGQSLGWSQYVSDREFIFGCERAARVHFNQQNVYYFRFSFSGSKNVSEISFSPNSF